MGHFRRWHIDVRTPGFYEESFHLLEILLWIGLELLYARFAAELDRPAGVSDFDWLTHAFQLFARNGAVGLNLGRRSVLSGTD